MFTLSSLIEADLDSGLPVMDPEASLEGGTPEWRLARVQTYQVCGRGCVRCSYSYSYVCT